METTIQSFVSSCEEEGLIYEDEPPTFQLKAVIAKCLCLGSITQKSVDKRVTMIMGPIKHQVREHTIANGGGRRRHASLEVIFTKILPLLVPWYGMLQYWIDMWHGTRSQHPWEIERSSGAVRRKNQCKEEEVSNTAHISVDFSFIDES